MANNYFKPKMPRVYKCLLVGDAGIGKTSFITRLLKGNFLMDYLPTKGAAVHPIEFQTDCGTVNFNVWDTAGQEKYAFLGNGYYLFADCAIIMFDLNSRETCRHVEHWLCDIEKVCNSEVPIVVVGNKMDIGRKVVHPNLLNFHTRRNVEYFDISTKTNFNIELPFLWLCKKMMKSDKLRLLNQPKQTTQEAIPSIQNSSVC